MITPLVLQVKGHLERDGVKLDAPRVQGKWDDAMYAELADGSQQLLWKISPMPANPTRCPIRQTLSEPCSVSFCNVLLDYCDRIQLNRS